MTPSNEPRIAKAWTSQTATLLGGLWLAGAQTPATPAAPAPAPSWQQGRTAEQSTSTLHPFAILTGRPASELPLDKLKVPAGFKVEVWADGMPEARSLALGDKGTVFVSNRNLRTSTRSSTRAASARSRRCSRA